MPAALLAEWILAGGPAIFPTDTLPALAALPAAAGQIWELKSRPSNKPLILMGSEPSATRRSSLLALEMSMLVMMLLVCGEQLE